MSKDKSRKDAAERVWSRLEESLLNASDEEILEDVRAEGVDPEKRAADVRALLLKTSRDFGKKKLLQARKGYDLAINHQQNKGYALPSSAEERRALLLATLSSRPDLKNITIQHREFSRLNDDDIESYLRILIDLGVMENK